LCRLFCAFITRYGAVTLPYACRDILFGFYIAACTASLPAFSARTLTAWFFRTGSQFYHCAAACLSYSLCNGYFGCGTAQHFALRLRTEAKAFCHATACPLYIITGTGLYGKACVCFYLPACCHDAKGSAFTLYLPDACGYREDAAAAPLCRAPAFLDGSLVLDLHALPAVGRCHQKRQAAVSADGFTIARAL